MDIKKLGLYIFMSRRYRKINNFYYYLFFKFHKLKNKKIYKNNLKKNIFAVDFHTQMGLGANLICLLEIIAFCEEKNLTPLLKLTNFSSKLKIDLFDSYFELPCSISFRNINYMKMRGFGDLEIAIDKNYNDVLNVKTANRLLNKYILVKNNILNEVATFQSKHFEGKSVLGVHFRGTDKKSEAKQVAYEKVLKNINHYLLKFPKTNVIFLSSDDAKFIKYIINGKVNSSIIYNNDCFRSSNDSPVHTSSINLYEINKDAIVNCLLLSKCYALIKTASLLSDCSKIFNPDIPTVLLNKPFERYIFFPGKSFYDDNLFPPID